ncbi:MAG TPA: tRNA lysidine(34) synthetase TilS [Verrucomicrobiae bacterium]|jgi:tRNA(Ile)-lysidine synthase|nr:tRNA lysidine(34) synthetase TilS [Verrucomicrobiae bacterium]
MPNDLQKRVLETIARHGMIGPGSRVGLGVSGGADSVALLRIFAELRARLGITIFVLHFHHQLRGAEADEDERFVKALAAEFRLEFEGGRADVAAEAKRNGWNLEDAARRLRHQFFSTVAAGRGLDRVAVAHTANDQAETVLSHLLRGTGLAGLAGIYPAAGLIIRPLLELGREEVREYLSELGQSWREDASNQDTSRTRARIRHELIPLLKRDFDRATVTRLARLATHAREEEEFWRALEDERLRALATRESSDAVSLSVEDLLAPLRILVSDEANSAPAVTFEPTMALTRRLVRRIYAELKGSREQLTSRHVDSVIDLAAKSQSGASVDLPGIKVERIFDRMVFRNSFAATRAARESEKRGAIGEFTYTVSQPSGGGGVSIVVTEIQRRFTLKTVDWPPVESDTVLGGGALDFDRVQWPLVLRNWRPGDSYRPHGSRRVRKLKRLLLESRVPRNARAGWPVLASEGRVIWALGYPAAEEVAASRGTQIGLMIGEEEL